MGGAGVVSSHFLRWFGLGQKAFCGGFLVALGHSLHFPHQPCLPQVPHHPASSMSRSLFLTEAHD
jgi:hypothetical protein